MKRTFLISLLLLPSLWAMAAKGNAATLSYIQQYHMVAVREMHAHGIPASITLAQGILESASGTSYLATKANNHFGIKCHLDWAGGKVYRDDDRKNECFRSYESADESFRDHSLFLKHRSRYASLFEEDPTDYKAWAKGLKKAGYATERQYAHRLIDLIERYELHKYDLMEYIGEPDLLVEKEKHDTKKVENVFDSFEINESKNRVDYVIARTGDTFEVIAQAAEKRVSDILKYNDLTYDDELKPGMLIYLQPKRRKAARENEVYVVKEGDDMYSISQKFAIRLKYLYRRNGMRAGQQPVPGQSLRLR